MDEDDAPATMSSAQAGIALVLSHTETAPIFALRRLTKVANFLNSRYDSSKSGKIASKIPYSWENRVLFTFQ